MKIKLMALDDGTAIRAMAEPVPGGKAVLTWLVRLLCAAVLAPSAFGAQAGVVFTSLHLFQASPDGKYPTVGLVEGSDGNFYGTTINGGTNGGYGTVFRFSTNGPLTSLYSFSGKDGAHPTGLVQGSDGNFYGTTGYGGLYNDGTVFKVSTNGVLTGLHSFTGGNDGGGPDAGLVQGSDGNFYGRTADGGLYNNGTLFKISANGVLASLYSFSDSNVGRGGLVQGSDGNFYGTTSSGGTNGGYGTVFKISTNGALTSLYSFIDGYDGGGPNAGLVQDSDGNLYGTTGYGGMYNNGTVFKISANGALTTLRFFIDHDDGGSPEVGLVRGNDGNFYGATYGGGTYDYGTVFKISANGALTTLHSFTGFDGAGGEVGLVQGNDGNFYGTTYGGGTNDIGTVFKMSATGTLTSLYSFTFTDKDDGADPSAGLVEGNDGNFYGTTYGGGTNGIGTLFKMSATGTLTSLYSFTFTDSDDGRNSRAGLVQGSNGSFYGTTEYGRTNGYGTVFQIKSNGALASLYSSTAGNDGLWGPFAGLVQGSDGNFYGTTLNCGRNGYGSVFQVSPNGALTSSYCFTGGNDGADPYAGLVQGNDGSFYGTTQAGGTNGYGTVFEIRSNGALTHLYSFTGGNGGAYPYAGLAQGNDGDFYGTTASGGDSGYGTIFKISTNGAHTRLYSFNSNFGATPYAGLVQGNDGNFYGTTFSGGLYNHGTVFKITTSGALTRLHSFTGGNDGAHPFAGLVQGNDGSFYGTTEHGGTNGYGTVFQINSNGALTSLYSFAGGNDGAHPSAGLVQGNDGSFYGTTTDGGGGAGTVFRLTIVPEPPTINCSAPSMLECENGSAVGTVQAEAQDTNGYPLQVVWTVDGTPAQTNNIPSGGTITAAQVSFTASFGLGEHAVVVSASNTQTNPVTCSTTVSVRDTMPPRIASIVASPNVLWPPNHRMIPIILMADAVDNCDPSPVVRITKVTSNEPENPLAPDWEITGAQNLNLRADRSGKGQGRIYTIVVQCKDTSGNVSTASVAVTVPHK